MQFIDSSSDITFQSSDGIFFHLHTKYLKISTKSSLLLPDCTCTSSAPEVVPLSEAASTLEILFQFCYPKCHPDLEGMEFNNLILLAEAVEKYKVFSAMDICKIRIGDTLPQHPFDIFVYAVNHGYPDIVEVAAPLVVFEKSMSDILPKLPSELVVPWAMYHEKWHQVARDAVSYYDTWKTSFTVVEGYDGRIVCAECRLTSVELDGFVVCLLRRFGGDLSFLKDLVALFTSSKFCEHVARSFFSWHTSIEENIKNIPKFREPAQSESKDVVALEPLSIVADTEPDITIQSSDGVPFQVHKLNLALSSAGFAPSQFETLDEIVELTETSTTLNLLLKFCYPDRHPDLTTLKFDVLGPLGDAAQKYSVYPAMNVCKICMRKLLPQHSDAILAYAARHNYPDLLDAAALSALKIPLHELVVLLPTHLVIPWVQYHEQWNQVLKDALSHILELWDNILRCTSRSKKLHPRVYERLLLSLNLGGVASLLDLDAVIGASGCCGSLRLDSCTTWRESVEKDIVNIRSFGNFL